MGQVAAPLKKTGDYGWKQVNEVSKSMNKKGAIKAAHPD